MTHSNIIYHLHMSVIILLIFSSYKLINRSCHVMFTDVHGENSKDRKGNVNSGKNDDVRRQVTALTACQQRKLKIHNV